MSNSIISSALLVTALAALPGLAHGAAPVCGKLGSHDVVVPASYAYSKAEYDDESGFVTCESKIDILKIQARRENLSRTSLGDDRFDRDKDFLITLQPKSDEPTVPIKEALAAIYDPENYSNGQLPYAKVKDGNGLIYIQGAQSEMSGHRTDIYLKSDKAGNTQFMVYCEITRGVRSDRDCMMGYTENDLGLNVIVKIDPSDVGDYRQIMHAARVAIAPIFPSKNHGE